MNKSVILILIIIFFLYILFRSVLYFFRKHVTQNSLQSYIGLNRECTSSLKLTYYNQIFTNDLEDSKDQKEVSCSEAIEILENFYGSGFQKGEIFLIGFYKDNDFFELSKDDQGNVSILRIEQGDNYIFEKSFTKEESVKALNVLWMSVTEK